VEVSVDETQHDGGVYTDTGSKARPFPHNHKSWDDLTLSQCIFMLNILSNVSLIKHHNLHGVYMSIPPSKVLRSVFRDSIQTRFHHTVSIQEGLLCSRLYPHFTLGIGYKVIQSCKMQPEIVSLCEYSEAGPQ
jgi:hypothetical protein